MCIRLSNHYRYTVVSDLESGKIHALFWSFICAFLRNYPYASPNIGVPNFKSVALLILEISCSMVCQILSGSCDPGHAPFLDFSGFGTGYGYIQISTYYSYCLTYSLYSPVKSAISEYRKRESAGDML